MKRYQQLVGSWDERVPDKEQLFANGHGPAKLLWVVGRSGR